MECDFLSVDTLFLSRFYVLCFVRAREPYGLRSHDEPTRAVGDAAGMQPADGARRPACPPYLIPDEVVVSLLCVVAIAGGKSGAAIG